MDVTEPDGANETVEDLTDEQLEGVAGGANGDNTGAHPYQTSKCVVRNGGFC